MRRTTLLGAAAGVAAVTVAARVVGFGRTAVLGRTLGTSCVGDVYQAANAVPNVVFEVVAGGALASLAVPVLAGALVSDDRDRASRTASALLSWTLLVLVPLAALGALLAPQLLRALLGDDPTCAPLVDAGARMLRVFMPQVALYGVGLVLAGVLQADRRFLGPALAPLLSSLVVIATYLVYAAGGRGELSRDQELVLAVGTTLGVAVLSLSLLVPLRRTGLRLRPALRFPDELAPRVRRLAVAGAAGLAAQQVALVVALRLAAQGDEGSVVVFQLATALFLLPWAVLAVPVATSAFPRLAASAEEGDEPAYAETAAAALRAVVVLALGGAAVLAVVAEPAARVLVLGAPGIPSVDELAGATAAFAPGLLGYAVLALVTRALFARHATAPPAVAVVAGWLTVAAADVALVAADVETTTALALGNTAGMTVAGVLLLVALRRVSAAATTGVARTGAVAAVAGVAAYALGSRLPDGPDSVAASVAAGAGLAIVTATAYAAVVKVGLR